MRGPGEQPATNYRYVITVDQSPAKAETTGYMRCDNARLAYTVRILDARKRFGMPNDTLPRIDTRSDRRAGVLHAVKVGPETITLRRRNASDVDISPSPVLTSDTSNTGTIIAYVAGAMFWGAILIYAALNFGYTSVLWLLLWIVGFVAIIGAVTFIVGAAGRGVSMLRDQLMKTERGRRVEYVGRRSLFYSYVVLITPVFGLLCLGAAMSILGQFVDTWITTPLRWIVGIRSLGHWIGVW